jgi:signal transduction histidine kinase
MERKAAPVNQIPSVSSDTFDHLEQQVAEKTKELAALNTIAAAVSQYLDLDQVLNNALDVTLQVMGIEAGGIYLLDEKAGLLVVRALQGFSSEFAAAIDRLQVGEGYSGRVIQTGKPMVVKDISQDQRLSKVAEWKNDVHSMAIIPLSSKGKTLGVMFVATEGARELDDPEFQLLVSIGLQIGVAVDNARLFWAEQRRAEQFRLIGEVGLQILSILDVDQLLDEIVHRVSYILGYYLVGIGLVEGDEIVLKVGVGPYWEGRDRDPLRLKIGQEGITGWVAATGEHLLAQDVTREPRYYRVPEIPETRSELAVPLRAQGRIIGVLDVQSKRLAAFDEGDVVVLQSLADQAAMAIENARLYEQARQLAVLEERHRLARDLHDSVTQALYGVTLYSEAAAGQLSLENVDKAAEHLHVLRHTAQEALAEMRLLIYELRPPVLEEEGLVAALQARLSAVEGRVGLQTRLKVEGEGQLPSDVEEGLYRIAQEALNNALKHAHAHIITVYVRHTLRGGDVGLEIIDDGEGFDLGTVREKGGLGLSTMEERATELGGHLSIISEPGEGTHVLVEVPL